MHGLMPIQKKFQDQYDPGTDWPRSEPDQFELMAIVVVIVSGG